MKLALSIVLILTAGAVHGARWRYGPETRVEPVQFGVTERLTIGDGTNRTWFIGGAWGVTFQPGPDMPEDQSSDRLAVGKSNGGRCYWSITFQFTKPIARFRLTPPRCRHIDLATGDFHIQGTVGKEKMELFRFRATSPGYRRDGTIEPVQGPWVELKQPAETLSLEFIFDGFVGEMTFFSGENDGGVLEYTTAVLPVEKMVEVRLFPDAREVANVYRVDEPIRAIIGVGPKLPPAPPELVLFDVGRKRFAGSARGEAFGSYYRADVPDVAPGIYELQVKGTSHEGPFAARRQRIVLVHPPRKLTRDQERDSPFGVVGITGMPALAKLTGIHQVRGGTSTWCTACAQGRGIYQLPDDYRPSVEEDMAYGLVRRNNVAFSPGWAVDPKRVAKGHWAGHYPPNPEFLPDFAEYCRRLARGTTGWLEPEYEIWNEPNGEPYGSFKGRFEEFVAFCRTAADAVHSVNPQARMILGTTGDADVGYIVRLLKAGLAEKFQIVDIHPYRHTDQGPEDGLLEDIYRLRSAIAAFGKNQSIIFSEIGWPTSPGYTGGSACYLPVTQLQQAWFFSRTLLISRAAGVERIFFHILKDWKSVPADAEANFGLVQADGEPKPSVSATAVTARHLERATFRGVLPGLPAFHHAWVWTTPWISDAALVTVWCDTVKVSTDVQWVSLPARPILAEDLWGGPPGSDRLRQKAGGWQVRPGEDPIFVYLPASSVPKDLAPLPRSMRPWNARQTSARPMKDGSVRVDGDLSEWGDLPDTIDYDRHSGSGSMGFAGIGRAATAPSAEQSRFAVGYDGRGLLLAARVVDPKPMHNDAHGWWLWTGDCVRVYLSTMDTRDVPYMSDDHFQFALAPVTGGGGKPEAAHISFTTPRGVKAGDLIPGAILQSRQGRGEWSVEALIPWDYFGKRPASGDVWSFDLEAGGKVWNGNESDWHNPLRWGRIEFGRTSP